MGELKELIDEIKQTGDINFTIGTIIDELIQRIDRSKVRNDCDIYLRCGVNGYTIYTDEGEESYNFSTHNPSTEDQDAIIKFLNHIYYAIGMNGDKYSEYKIAIAKEINGKGTDSSYNALMEVIDKATLKKLHKAGYDVFKLSTEDASYYSNYPDDV